MTKFNPFDHIVSHSMSEPNFRQISNIEYEEWKKQYIFDVLQNVRYGESFCKYFNIPNSSPLYYLLSAEISDDWIRKFYLK